LKFHFRVHALEATPVLVKSLSASQIESQNHNLKVSGMYHYRLN